MPGEARARASSVLVVGGGISGMTAAIEASEAGREVYLVEKAPSLGGRVARMHQYFPKLCPPSCGLEINFQRLRRNPHVRVLTDTTVRAVAGGPGAFTVTLRTAPQFVTPAYGTTGQGVDLTPEVPDDLNFGMSTRRALYLPNVVAHPMRYHVDEGALTGAELRALAAACEPGTIDAEAKEKVFDVQVGAIVLATGWTPYDAAKLDRLGFGTCPDVVTNVMMERLAATTGPTGGKILRRSSGEPARRVAFVQCAGSRDENHLAYCSGVCCLGSLKQALYVREKDPEAEVEVFYIDLRAPGRLEDFLVRVQKDAKVVLTKGKVAEVTQAPGGNVTVVAEDVMGGGRVRREFDLVVLATGIVPNAPGFKVPGVAADEFGFVTAEGDGVFAAGCLRAPADVATSVQDATGAALSALIATA
jgi:quinone-modifying oxidoreductase subunit QmoA